MALPYEQPGAAPEVAGTQRRSLADLLLRQAEARASGTITLARGQVRKQLELRDGLLVSADSNLREEALGAVLVAQGLLDEPRLAELLAEVKKRGRKMGTVLLELGWVTAGDVVAALGAQVRRRAVSCLRWSESEAAFEPRGLDIGRAMEHPFELPPLVFAGLRETSSLDLLAPQFDDDGARIVRLAPRFARFRQTYVEAFGDLVPSLLADGAVLGSLVLQPEAETLIHGLEALLVTGLAYFEDAGDSEAAGLPAAVLPPLELASVPQRQRGEESGLVDIARLSAAAGLPAPSLQVPGLSAREEAELTAELLREYLEVDAKSPAEVLGVDELADRAAMDAALESRRERALALGARLPAERDKVTAVIAAYERAHAELVDPRARPAAVANASAGGRDDALDAELRFGEARALLAEGNFPEALDRFAEAVASRPDQAAYHAWRGWAQFLAGGAAAADGSRVHIQHAIALDPDSAEAHLLAGRLAAATGDAPAARAALERTLVLEPEQPEAIDLLVEVFRQAGSPRLTEKLYNRLLTVLGERALPLRRRLWRALAELCEGPLDDRAGAGAAYAMAARLSPEDESLRRKVLELEGASPGAWREPAEGLAAEWLANPQDRRRPAALRDLLLRAGQQGAAGLVAAAEVLRGMADPDIGQLAERQRPQRLVRIAGPFPTSVWEAMGYGAHDQLIEALFATLAESHVLPAQTPGELGVEDDRPCAWAELPRPLQQTLGYVSELLGIEPPRQIFRHPSLGGRAVMAHLHPPALLVGPDLWTSVDALELAHRLGRALALAPLGRCASAGLAGRELRPYLLACLALSAGQMPGDPEAQGVLASLSAVPPHQRVAIVDRTREMRASRSAVNLSAWIRLVRTLAARVGLLVCGDLLRVGRAIAAEEEPADLERLLGFAVSLPHFDLRASHGANP